MRTYSEEHLTEGRRHPAGEQEHHRSGPWQALHGRVHGAWAMADDGASGRGRGGRRNHGGHGGGRGGHGEGGHGDIGHGGFGFGGFGRRGGGRRGGRGGRGDVRAAVLLLLAEQPMHGYQLIQQITERSDGVWTPSPGSVYPALSQLEDEGLVTFDRVEGRKTASLTDEGRAYVEAHRGELGSPWDDVGGGLSSEARDLRTEVGALMGAAHQVMQVGSRGQVARAAALLADTRKALYRVLAEDQPDS